MYACLAAVVLVNVIKPNRGSSHKAHLASMQQLLIYLRARTHEESLSMAHRIRSDILGRKINHLYLGREYTLQKGYAFVYDNLLNQSQY